MSDILDLSDLVTELDDLLVQRDMGITDEHDRERLVQLLRFAKSFRSDTGGDLRDCADNEPTAIAESGFTEYAEQLADDLGYLSNGGRDDRNPLLDYIDWERWASDLKVDYTSFEYEGWTYLVRSY